MDEEVLRENTRWSHVLGMCLYPERLSVKMGNGVKRKSKEEAR